MKGCVPRLRVAQLLHAREGEQGGDRDPTGVIQKLLDHEAIRSSGHASQVPLHLRAHEGNEARGGACGGAHEGGGQEEGQAGLVREGAGSIRVPLDLAPQCPKNRPPARQWIRRTSSPQIDPHTQPCGKPAIAADQARRNSLRHCAAQPDATSLRYLTPHTPPVSTPSHPSGIYSLPPL
eukprot:scaffold785_cov85-Isochrysis_galbana.AAC.1